MKKNVLIGGVSVVAFLAFVGSIVLLTTGGFFNDSNIINNNGNNNEPPFNETPQENGEYSKFTYENVYKSSLTPVTPSKGDVNILVVPVEFSDLNSFTSDNLELINYAFNGSNEDNTTSYWESCKSFYYKSSNGALNFNFEVADVFVPSITSTTFNRYADDYGTESSMILDEIAAKGLTINNSSINFNDKKYDSNNDGTIDGVWMIYNATSYLDVYGRQKYWAYTTSYGSENPTVHFGKYANGSILFLGENGQLPRDSKNADAHTIIHETGHMLGLDDYYDYCGENNYSYTGLVDMMDLNIGDHDAFSKYALGWTKSLVVSDERTLTLKPFATSFDSIILPSGTYNGSAFSEYLIIEYYTPEGLFAHDSENKYGGLSSSYPKFFTESGLRIYHIDARLCEFNAKYNMLTHSIEYEFGDYLTDINLSYIPGYQENMNGTEASWTEISHTNCPNDSTRNKDGKALITLVSSQNELLFGRRGANNNDLYTENLSDGYAFSYQDQNKYFTNGKFNDGSEMNYTIKINGTTQEGINITIGRN